MSEPTLLDHQPLMAEVLEEVLALAEERLPTPHVVAMTLTMAAAEAAIRAGISRTWLLEGVALAYDEGERPVSQDS